MMAERPWGEVSAYTRGSASSKLWTGCKGRVLVFFWLRGVQAVKPTEGGIVVLGGEDEEEEEEEEEQEEEDWLFFPFFLFFVGLVDDILKGYMEV